MRHTLAHVPRRVPVGVPGERMNAYNGVDRGNSNTIFRIITALSDYLPNYSGLCRTAPADAKSRPAARRALRYYTQPRDPLSLLHGRTWKRDFSLRVFLFREKDGREEGTSRRTDDTRFLRHPVCRFGFEGLASAVSGDANAPRPATASVSI